VTRIPGGVCVVVDCIFCKIAAKEIPSDIVAEDDQVVAFSDINPQAPVHVLVIPKRHIANVAAAGAQDQDLLGHLLRVGAQVAAQAGVAESGFRLVINRGPHSGEAVPHLHLHVVGGRPLGWPPG
jgi:histidine triad (HIT) family protein